MVNLFITARLYCCGLLIVSFFALCFFFSSPLILNIITYYRCGCRCRPPPRNPIFTLFFRGAANKIRNDQLVTIFMCMKALKWNKNKYQERARLRQSIVRTYSIYWHHRGMCMYTRHISSLCVRCYRHGDWANVARRMYGWELCARRSHSRLSLDACVQHPTPHKYKNENGKG